MAAYSVVRYRVKAGREDEFLAKNRELAHDELLGFQGGALIKTGERGYCFIGEWDSFDAIVNARPTLIGFLDTFRDMLEDLGCGLGVTDPVSGEAVLEFPGL